MARLKILDLKARSGTETARGAMVLEGTVNANQFQITHLEVSFGSTARKVKLNVPQTLNFSGALPGNIEELFFKVSGQTLTLRVDLASEPDFARDLQRTGFAGLRLGVDITQIELQIFVPGPGDFHSTERPFLTLSTCFDLAGQFDHTDNLPGGGTSDVTLQAEVAFCTRLAIPLPPSDLLGALGNVFVRLDFPLAALSTGWRTFLELFPQVPTLPDFNLPDLPGVDVPSIDLGWSIPLGWLAGLCNVSIPNWLTLPEWDFSADLAWFDMDVDLPAVSFKPTKNKLTLKRQGSGVTVLELKVTAFELQLGEFKTVLPDDRLRVEISAQLNGSDVTYSVSVRSGFTLDEDSYTLPLDLLSIGWKKVGFWLLYQDNSTGGACFGAHLEIDSLVLKSTFMKDPLLEGHLRLVVLDGSVVSHESRTAQWRLGTPAGQAHAQKKHTYFASTAKTEEGTDYGIEVLDGDVTEEGRVRLVWKEASPWRWLSALGADIFGSTPPGPISDNDRPRFCALDIFKVEDPETNKKVFQARFDWADVLVQPGPAVGLPVLGTVDEDVCFKPGDPLQYPVKVTATPDNKSQTKHELQTTAPSLERMLDLPGFALSVQPPAFHSLILSQADGDDIGAAYVVTFDMPAPQIGTPISPLISAQLSFSTGSGSSRQTLGGTQVGSSQPSKPFAELALGHLGTGRVSLQVVGYTRAEGLRLMRGRRIDLDAMPVLLNAIPQPPVDDQPQCPGPPAVPPEARAIVPRQFSGLQMGGDSWAARLSVPALKDAFGLFGSKNAAAPVTFELTEVCINPEDTSAFTLRASLGVKLLNFELQGDGSLTFDLDTGSVKVDFDDALALIEDAQTTAPQWLQDKRKIANKTFIYSIGRDLFGQSIVFRKPKADGEPDNKAQFLELVIADGQFQLEMLPGVEAFIAVKDFAEAPIVFRMHDVSIGTEGFSFATDLITKEVKFEGLNAPFIFETASLEVANNKLVSFNLDGSTTLPKDILGGGEVGVTVVGTQNTEGKFEIASAGASLKGDLLKIESESVRFNFELTEVGLFYQKNPQSNSPQFYFEITGSATFKPNPGEFSNGLLGYFENITITFDEMRLTDEFIEGLELRAELKKPIKFGVFGLFEMEIRSLGIAPKFEPFNAPALMIGGKVEFSLGEDLVDADIKFHTLYLGPPKPGDFLPQVHFKGLRVEIATAEGFRIAGRVDAMDEDNIKGFGGEGLLEMPSFPAISAAFTFARIKVGDEWKHAWFIAIGLNKVSFGVQPIPLYLRAIRAGFGHRFQLKLLDAVDQTDDPKTLINLLTEAIAKSPAIDRLDAWVPDFAKRNRGRNMIVIEADLTLATANSTPLEYNAKAERKLGNVTVRAQFIFRDDGTFIATFKGWVFAPYDFILEDKSGEASRPSLAGFALISSQKEMFLFHARSLENAYMGPKNLPVPEMVKDALRAVRFDATILATPRVLHAELGWPDRLIWGQSLGPLSVSIRGGVLLRVEDGLVLYGSNFIAQGRLSLSGGFSLGFIGIRIEATASVGYGQQLMALVDTRKPLDSKVYAAVGIDIRVTFRASAYLRFKAGFVRITWRISFSFDIQITAGVEFGAAGQMDLGIRARAYVSVGVFGRRLGVRISLGVRDGAVDRARQSVLPFMNSILEPDKPIPTIPGLGPERVADTSNVAGGTVEFASARRLGGRSGTEGVMDAVIISETTPDGITTFAAPPAAPAPPTNWGALSHVYTGADANQGRTDDKIWLVWIMPGQEAFLPILDPRIGQTHFKLKIPSSEASVFALKNVDDKPVWTKVEGGGEVTPYVNPLAERKAESSETAAESQFLKLFQMLAGAYVPNPNAPVGADGVVFPYNLADTSSKAQIESLINFGAELDKTLQTKNVEEDSRRIAGDPLNPNATLDLEDAYDKALQESVSEPEVFSDADDWDEIYSEQAITTRNLLMQEFAGAHAAWAEWVTPEDVENDKPAWRKDQPTPLLFATGLVLAIKGKDLPAWVKDPMVDVDDALQIAPAASNDDGVFKKIPAEMDFGDWAFEKAPPIFRDISTYYDEEQIAVRWNLAHPEMPKLGMPHVEAMLRHYQVEVVRDDGETVVDTIKAKPTATVSGTGASARLLLSKAQLCMPTVDIRRLMRVADGATPPRFYLNVTPVAATGERGLPITIEMNFKAVYKPLPAQDPRVKQSVVFEDDALEPNAKLEWEVPLLPESGQATRTADWELIMRPLRALGPARFPLSDEDAQTNGLATQAQSDSLPGDLIITLGERVQEVEDPTGTDKRIRFVELQELQASDSLADFFEKHVKDHEGNTVEPNSPDGLVLQRFLASKGVLSEHGRKWLFRLRPIDDYGTPGTAINCPVYLETRSDAPKDPVAVDISGGSEEVTEQAEFRPLTRRVVPAFEWPELSVPDEAANKAFKIKRISAGQGPLYRPEKILNGKVQFEATTGDALYTTLRFTLPQAPAAFEGVYIDKRKFFAEVNEEGAARPEFRANPLLPLRSAHEARLLPDTMAKTMDWTAHYHTSDKPLIEKPVSVQEKNTTKTRQAYYADRDEEGNPTNELMMQWPDAMERFAELAQELDTVDLTASEVLREGASEAQAAQAKELAPDRFGEDVKRTLMALARMGYGASLLDAQAHPFLALIAGALRAPVAEVQDQVQVQTQPPASDKNTLPSAWMRATAAGADPYGWAVLAHLGLGMTLRLRKRWSQTLLEPQQAVTAVKAALALGFEDVKHLAKVFKLLTQQQLEDLNGLRDLNISPVIEQPLLRVRALKATDGPLGLDDLGLYMLQVSLRPFSQPEDTGKADAFKTHFEERFKPHLKRRFDTSNEEVKEDLETLDVYGYGLWSRRFFQYMAAQEGGVEVVPAYLSSPMFSALVPDSSNTVSFTEEIPDQWATQLQYRVTMQGRYDALRMALLQDPTIHRPPVETNTIPLPRRVPVAPVQVLAVRRQISAGLRPTYHVVRKEHQNEALSDAGQRQTYAVQNGASWIGFMPEYRYKEAHKQLKIQDALALPAPLGGQGASDPVVLADLPTPDPLRNPLETVPLARHGATEIASYAPAFYYSSSAALFASADGKTSDAVTVVLPNIPALTAPQPAPDDALTVKRESDAWPWTEFNDLQTMETLRADWAQHFNVLDSYAPPVSVQSVRIPRLFESLPLDQRQAGGWLYPETQPLPQADGATKYTAGFVPDPEARLDLVVTQNTGEAVFATLKSLFGTPVDEDGTLFELGVLQSSISAAVRAVKKPDFAASAWVAGTWADVGILPITALSAHVEDRQRLRNLQSTATSSLRGVEDALPLVKLLLQMRLLVTMSGDAEDIFEFIGMPGQPSEMRRLLGIALNDTHVGILPHVPQAMQARIAFNEETEEDIPTHGISDFEFFVEVDGQWEPQSGTITAGTSVIVLAPSPDLSALEGPFSAAALGAKHRDWRASSATAAQLVGQIVRAEAVRAFEPNPTDDKAPRVSWFALRGALPRNLWGTFDDG